MARPQHLGSRTEVFLQGVFGRPLLGAMLRMFLLIALFETICEPRVRRGNRVNGLMSD